MGVYYRTFLFSLFSYFHLLSTKNSVTLFFFFEHFAKKMVENSHGKCSTEPSKSAVIHPPHCAIGWNRQKWKLQIDFYSCFLHTFCIIVEIGEKSSLKPTNFK